MPLIPAGLSNLNEKVESARKGFNAKLDKAGHKSGVFKPPPGSTTSSKPPSSAIYPSPSHPPPPSIAPRPIHPSSSRSYQPPPPPPTRNHLPTPSNNLHLDSPPPPPPPVRPKFGSGPPPPPPRRTVSSNQSHQADRDSYDPTPSHPIYRPPPTSFNGYGPPSMPPVQPSSRYGPPSPPRSRSQSREPAPADPPPPVISKKPTNWQASQTQSIPAPSPGPPPPPSSSLARKKHGQIPFPPFSQFTEKDKQAFFRLLDEFFSQKFPGRIQAVNDSDHSTPPNVSLHTRPSIAHFKPQGQVNSNTKEPSKAESLAGYFKNYRSWTSHSDQWYHSSDPVPTPVQGSQDIKRISAWSQMGNERTQTNYILFSDLSQIWSQVVYDVSRPYPVRSAQARFRPPPDRFDRRSLVDSSQIYGHQLVLFAEDAERSGRHVSRGECWDLANEALKAFPASQLGHPPPLTSISRTHGILLYYGRSTGRGSGFGSWKQPDDMGGVRPGDVIEWRLVACDTVNPTLSFTLGDPDHTAIIVDATDCGISIARADENHPPDRLGYITVVEQSLKQIPIRRTYDLSTISKGEVWIYRPMAEADLLGPAANQCSFPPPGPTLEP